MPKTQQNTGSPRKRAADASPAVSAPTTAPARLDPEVLPATQARKAAEPRKARMAAEAKPVAPIRDAIAEALNSANLTPKHLAAATERWQAARQAGHDPAAACLDVLQSLRDDRLFKAAEAMLRGATAAFPDQAWPLAELAASRARLGDHEATLSYARQIIQRFPGSTDGPRLELTALIALGRKDEAQTIFRDLSLDPAQHVLHRVEWFMILGMRLAAQRNDYTTALLYAAALRDVAPENPSGYANAASALRELQRPQDARDIVQAGLKIVPDAQILWKELALVAQDLNEHDQAYAHWEEITRRFPRSAAGYIGALSLSRKLQHPTTTAALLDRALKAFPKNPHILTFAARVALRSNRVEEATDHWDTLIAEKPDDPDIALAAAKSLMARRRGRTKRLPGVFSRLAELQQQFPNYAPGFTTHLEALREAEKSVQADRLGVTYARRFPADQDLAMVRALIAEDLEEPDNALKIIEEVRGLSAPTAACEAAYVRALCLGGRPDDAEAACDAALELFADAPDLLTEHVRLATRRGDWAEALRRALAAQRKRPRDGAMLKLVQSIRAQVVDDGATDGTATPLLANEEALSAEAGFMLGFESLGATSAGCEFGVVQRRYGAEPLGLFRWALIPIDRLVETLQKQLEGIGDESTTELVVRRESASHQEYYVVDQKIGYLTHTFVKVEDSPADRMLKQSVRRIRFLKAKLIEDMKAAEKIFVYKYALRFDEAAVRALFAALRTYGNCTLLCVTLADQKHPKGTLEMLEPGLFVGRAGMFMDAVVPDEQGIDAETWHTLCSRVAAWQAARLQAA